MLKLALVFTFGAGTMFVAGNAGRVHHSGLQAQLFQGTAMKVAPDPSNIWSFHETVTVPARKTVTVPVVVDFDGNKKMDTELKFARVLVTDLQVANPGFSSLQALRARLVDATGVRWDLSPEPFFSATSIRRPVSHHLVTPLALPVGSSSTWSGTSSQTGQV